MPRSRARSLASPELGRGGQPGEADRRPPGLKRGVRAVERGYPRLPRGLPADTPSLAEDEGKAGESVFGSPPAYPGRGRSVSCLPGCLLSIGRCLLAWCLPAAEYPSWHAGLGMVGDGRGGTASAGLVSCAECSSMCGWDGVARVVPGCPELAQSGTVESCERSRCCGTGRLRMVAARLDRSFAGPLVTLWSTVDRDRMSQ